MTEKKEKSKNKKTKEENLKDNQDIETNEDITNNDANEENEKNDNNQSNIEEKTTEEKLMEEVEQLKEEKIRLLAEMENIRKRFEREKVESVKFGSINLARDILSPSDNIERALSAIPEDEDHSQSIKNLIDGLKMVQKEFSTILEKNEIKRIESLDKKFDPTHHQAMMEVEKDDVEEGIVVQEIQAGYTMFDRLLRPAMVGVSKKPLLENNNVENLEDNNQENIEKKPENSEK